MPETGSAPSLSMITKLLPSTGVKPAPSVAFRVPPRVTVPITRTWPNWVAGSVPLITVVRVAPAPRLKFPLTVKMLDGWIVRRQFVHDPSSRHPLLRPPVNVPPVTLVGETIEPPAGTRSVPAESDVGPL